MRQLVVGVVLWGMLLGLGGCHKQKGTDEGKTYAPDGKGQGAAGGASGSGASGGQGGSSSGGSAGNAGPLNSPANTTNGKASPPSDAGSSEATRGQVVVEPGAPVEHDQRQKPAGHKAPPR